MIRLYLLIRKCSLLLLLLGSVAASAQSVVSGKVTSSDDGSGIPGVNVLEKGTSNGTATDVDGNFRINVGANATLVFSFVGYTTQEVPVAGQSTLNVTLQSDVTALSEIVVTGYGGQEKKEITGAVVSLSTKDFNKGNVNDPTQLLQGKVAGLSIYNKGGDPNSSATIRLRGLSTVGANAQPLVVVDGVLGASLSNIDPNDIASINVLKDGSAAAIYGSRGSSGVILVTTKRGTKGGGLSVNFNTYVAASTIYKQVPVMTHDEYIANGGNDLGSNTDWQKQVTQTGLSAVQNLSVSGGTEHTTFRLSTNFRNVNGILKKSGFDRVNTRANITHTALNNKLKIDLNMSFTNNNQDFSFNEALRYAALYNPTAPIYFPNGQYYQAILFDNFNPVAILDQNTNTGKSQNLNYSAKIDYNLLDNLTFTVNLGQQFNNSRHDQYYASNSLFRGYNRNGLAIKDRNDDSFTLFEAYGTYLKSFDKLDLTFTGGYSYQEQVSQGVHIDLGNFPSDALGGNAIQYAGDRLSGKESFVNLSSYQSPKNKIIAGFARLNLMWDNAIFFNASVRQEGSTKLGPDNKWGTFPSFGAGVDINHYLQLPKFNLLKFRIGYGVTGSLPNDSGLSQDQYAYNFGGGGSVTKTVDGNKDLKWEQKAETDIGIEFGAGKIYGTLDVYDRNITNGLWLTNVDVTQFPSGKQWQNAVGLNTKGIELALNYDFQFGAVSWTPGIVGSHYQSILKDYVTDIPTLDQTADFGAPGQNGTFPIKVEVGQPIGTIWGPVFDHVSTGSASDGGVAAGAPVFKDLNGDGKIVSNPSDALAADADMKKLGTGIPTFELGWTNRLTYKQWDLNVFFRGAFGHSLINQFRAFYEPIDPGAINSYNRVITSKAPAGLNTAQYSSLYVEKANFIRLDNMTIGYNFNITSNYIKSLRAYFTGQNLFYITKYTGIDPDPVLQDYGNSDNGGFTASQPDILAPGFDRRNNYFSARTFTVGLTVGF